MPRRRWTDQELLDALDTFFAVTDELTHSAWIQYVRAQPGPFPGHKAIEGRFEGETLTTILCALAVERAPRNRTYTWAICPRGEQHQTERWTGTVTGRLAADCPRCTGTEQKRVEWRQRTTPPGTGDTGR